MKEDKINENTQVKDKSKSKKEKKLTKVQQLEKELENAKNDHLRILAEFQNFRNRNQKELILARDRTIEDFVLNLLPTIDNFEMSLKMSDNTQMFIKGVEMIHKNLLDTLKEHKINSFNPSLGEKFNPYLHDPILIEDSTKNPGEIIGVIKKGFKHNDKIIRPARVQVVKEEKKDN